MKRNRESQAGFTLIELLIVVAIIAILAAIAVPNFLEAQTRSKTSRARADMRTMVTAHAAYRVDYNDDPLLDNVITTSQFDRMWWGFSSRLLTTPVAYITSIPNDIFPDFDNGVLSHGWHDDGPRPYVAVVRASDLTPGSSLQDFMWLGSTVVSSWPGFTENQRATLNGASAVYSSAGPDDVMQWVYQQVDNVTYPAAFYDPTNGTVSFGDIFRRVD